MTRLTTLAALALTACTNGPCAKRSGTYLWAMTTRSGDCGDMPETVFTVTDEPPGPTLPCTGTITYSPDNCEVTRDELCPVDGDGGTADGTFTVRGVIDWNAAATAATGVLDYALDAPDPEQSCHGTYDATYRKL
jgi:hypothetical protein